MRSLSTQENDKYSNKYCSAIIFNQVLPILKQNEKNKNKWKLKQIKEMWMKDLISFIKTFFYKPQIQYIQNI